MCDLRALDEKIKFYDRKAWFTGKAIKRFDS